MLASKLIDLGRWTSLPANVNPFSTVSLDQVERQQLIPEGQTTARILVAEFDQSTLHMLNSCIQPAGFEVIYAADGLATWRLLQTQTLQLALMNAALPRLSTGEIVRRIRRSQQLAKLPVILLGDPISTQDRIDWFKLGVDDYVSIPFSTCLLAAQIRAFVRRGDRT
jgi:DNA-binding response OmpR family regulator